LWVGVSMRWCVNHNKVLFLLLILMLTTLSTSLYATLNPEEANHKKLAKALPNIELSVEELRLFVEVMQRIKGAYVDPIDDKVLMNNAINGMVEGLDRHSIFLTHKNLQQLRESTSGKFAGIGVEVDIKKNAIHVIRSLHNTPASRAGILPGDKIISLNDSLVATLSDEEVAGYMRGKPGSILSLAIKREGREKPIKMRIARAIISMSSVEHRFLDEEIGYINVNQFQKNTALELEDSIFSLQVTKPLSGLILDLRGNPGGVLQAAVDVADLFISHGIIVSTRGRLIGSDLNFSASKQDMIEGLPLVVLIDGHSASASEIVAGALQDHKRAIIVGTKSYGKGSVQSILPLFSGFKPVGLKLTTARYYTPSGRSIQSTGITPDINVPASQASSSGKVKEDAQLLKALAVLKSLQSTHASIKLDNLRKATKK